MGKIILVSLITTLGPIEIKLFTEEAPETSQNFIEYVESGFFDETIFHRVIPGFVIQGGGLISGLERKETMAPIQNEANNGIKNLQYTLSMARTNDPHSATSQFFINLQDNSSLDHSSETPMGWGYAVFGEVVNGTQTVEAIAKVETGNYEGHQDVPVEEIKIIKAEIMSDE